MIKIMSFFKVLLSLCEYINFWVLKSYTVTAWIVWMKKQIMKSSRLENILKIKSKCKPTTMKSNKYKLSP